MQGAIIFLGVAIIAAALIISGNGGAILLFGGLVCFLILLGLLLDGILNFFSKRSVKKLRRWLLGIFDRQLEQLRFRMEQEGRNPKPYGLDFSDLRWQLTISDYFFSDLARFKDKGAPILLAFPKEAEQPRLFFGINNAENEVPLDRNYSVLAMPERRSQRLNAGEIAALKAAYPDLRGDEFTYCCAEDPDRARAEKIAAECETSDDEL